AAGGFVGVAGSVGVTLIHSDTQALVGSNVQINQADDPIFASSNQGVFVNAGNDTHVQTFIIGIAGGAGALAGAVDVGNVHNNTKAEVNGGGTKLRAKGSVGVNAVGTKKLDGLDVSGSVGAVGVGGSVSVWSIGQQITKDYKDKDGNSDTATNPSGGSGAADSDAAGQAHTASSGVTGGGGLTGS